MPVINLFIQPDTDCPEAAEVFVDVKIGERDYRFLLDTGAAVSHLQYDSYTSTFPCASKREISGAFSRRTGDLIIVPYMSFGLISRNNVMLVRAAPDAQNVGNLFGMDLLRDFNCSFYFDKSMLILNEKASSYTCYQPLVLDNKSHPYIEVILVNVAVRAAWDTGAGMTVVDLGFANNHPELFRQAGHTEGTDSGGISAEIPVFFMAPITIGGVEFPEQRVVGIDLAPMRAKTNIQLELIIGYSTMRRANWAIQFPHRRWAIL